MGYKRRIAEVEAEKATAGLDHPAMDLSAAEISYYGRQLISYDAGAYDEHRTCVEGFIAMLKRCGMVKSS